MRISDWSSDVCSSDLNARGPFGAPGEKAADHGSDITTSVHPEEGLSEVEACPERLQGSRRDPSRRTATQRQALRDAISTSSMAPQDERSDVFHRFGTSFTSLPSSPSVSSQTEPSSRTSTSRMRWPTSQARKSVASGKGVSVRVD